MLNRWSDLDGFTLSRCSRGIWRTGIGPNGEGPQAQAVLTTNTLDRAMAAPASIGLSSPKVLGVPLLVPGKGI